MTTRGRKRHSPEQIIAKLRDAEAMLNAGKDLAVALQALESEPVDVRALACAVRRHEGPGGQAAEGAGGREPPAEAVGGRPGPGHPDAEAHQRGKLVSPSRKRAAVGELQSEFAVSERRACKALDQPRRVSVIEQQPRSDEPALLKRMLEVVRQRPRFGYRRVGRLLAAEGWRAGLGECFGCGVGRG